MKTIKAVGLKSSFKLALSLCIFLLYPTASYSTTVTGFIKNGAGVVLASGTITLQLSQDGTVVGPGFIYAYPPVACTVTAGVIVNCTVTSNNDISPAGTYYKVRIVGVGGVEVMRMRNYTITGTTWDIGDQVPLATAPEAAGAYQIMAQGGTKLAQQRTLNFIGASVSCVNNSSFSRTDCTFTGVGGGGGIGSLNGLTVDTQNFATGTLGTAPAFSSATSTHTLNIPLASATGVTAGLLSKTDYNSFAAKGNGTVTNVTFTGDGTVLSSTPSAAVTTTGTLTAALLTQAANKILAGPATGSAVAPTFRSLVVADLPAGAAITIASGAQALGTGAINSATCATAVDVSATGVLTTDVIQASFNGDPTALTGYIPLATGMLTIIAYPTADNVHFKVCNNTAASITPGAVTLNWRVTR